MNSVFFHRDDQGRSRGTGGVIFERPKDAKMAHDYYNLLFANDKTSLYVNEKGKHKDEKRRFDGKERDSKYDHYGGNASRGIRKEGGYRK